MKKSILLFFTLTIAVVCVQALDAIEGCPTREELSLIPWTDITHTHDDFGTHTHEDAVRVYESETCNIYGYDNGYRAQHGQGVFGYNTEHGTRGDDQHGALDSKEDQEFLEDLTPEDVKNFRPEYQDILKNLTPEQAKTLKPETREVLGLPDPPDSQLQIIEQPEVLQVVSEPEPQQQQTHTPQPVTVPGLTPEEIGRLPEEVQTFLQSVPDSVTEVIEVLPTAASIAAERGLEVHIHTAASSAIPSLPRTTHDETQEDVFLENVQFLVFAHPIVTEYMLSGWSKKQKNLPRWIEIYNPHASPVNLKGWRLKYIEKGQMKTLRIRNFRIPAGGVGLLASHAATWKSPYIEDDAVYVLGIAKRSLESGWLLLDAEGNDIHRIGVAFRTDALLELSDPVKPDPVKQRRVSHNRYASELPSRGHYYYGYYADIGTPGFFQLPVAASPSKVRPKLKTSWGAIKKL